MTDGGESTATVLIVEDEEALAQLFVTILKTTYSVEWVADGSEAIDRLDDDIDVVILDRRMPKVSGDAVLEYIESENIDCRVAMVTGVDPDYDVIDMGFDDYLVKPIENDQLHRTVERLLALDHYESLYQELSSKLVKKNVLQAEKEAEELGRTDEYKRLEEDIAELEEQLDSIESEQEFDERLLPG